MLKSTVPYLFFNGQCKDALAFYSKVLNGEIKDTMTYGETNEVLQMILIVSFMPN